MSARALRIYLEEQEEKKQRLAAVQEEEGLDSPEPASTTRRNVFDLLDDGDGENEMEEEPESEGNVAKISQKEEKSFLKKSADVVPLLERNAKKKKKKKKAKESSTQIAGKKEKPLDIILNELALDSQTAKGHYAPSKGNVSMANVQKNPSNQSQTSVLEVDPKLLRPENELKRIFGSKVVSSYGNSSQAGTSRQMRGGRRVGHIMRKTILAAPSEGWSIWDKSLSMELLETKAGVHYFRYLPSPEYEQAQRAYEAAKNLHDLNVVYSILVDHPYHLDSLLAISEYFKLVGEQQLAANAIAKCLYALECAWHPLFTPLQGNCRLEFIHETNKPFFKILFTHMKNTDRRGCHRVALELCKLLLSLDPDDPMGVIFCIDYYAIRAEQYTWLEQFSEEYGNDNSIWLFPNFSYSLAVSRYFLEDDKTKDDTHTEKASSAELMKQALMLHPTVLKKLVAKVPLKDQIWNTVLKNSFFKADESGSPTLDHLIDIYVERSYLIWRLPDLQNLLKDSALQVIEVLKQSRSEAEDWACVRTEAFSSEKNEYSHLLVSDFSDTVSTIPPEELQNLMGGGAPGIIPQAGRFPHGIAMEENEEIVIELPQGNRIPRDIANRNPLAVLIESLLPGAYYGGVDDGHNEEGNEDQ